MDRQFQTNRNESVLSVKMYDAKTNGRFQEP
jgi:hypothetical protein